MQCSTRLPMHVRNFYSSEADPCGISIFSGHLTRSLQQYNVDLVNVNIRSDPAVEMGNLSIVHYVPSGYSTRDTSDRLMRLIASHHYPCRLIVVLHGMYAPGESRFLDDTTCPDQAVHSLGLLKHAESVIALSSSVASVCRAWNNELGLSTRIVQSNHPGLFIAPHTGSAESFPYALLAGVSRSKKSHSAEAVSALTSLLASNDIRVWEHWTNVEANALEPRSWRQTSGLLSDEDWTSLVANAAMVLCPYRTKVQSVSGLMSEALSAGRVVLCSGFDVAYEMQALAPHHVFVEERLERWPECVRQILSRRNAAAVPPIPTWADFARELVDVLKQGRTYA